MNKYQKVKMIGEGSFGKAFLVRDRATNKQYVIKEINMSRMGSKEREDARKEVAVLAQLQHPNIVSYKESFEEMGNLFISMDYCECGDLYSKINKQRGVLMPETQVLDMFVQVCLSIKHIHDRKILHRDIKSQNIFITKGGIMKLGDFGIAKVMSSTVELARTCIGTPYYLSPEMCENRPYNNKSDIWSLGCVLYEMATLKHPFEAGSMKNLVLKIIRGTYPPVPPRYSYELRNLLTQLFKRNPRDRPSINAILKKPFIQERIKKFLSDSEVQSEFSHTILHGERLQKRLPPGGRPVSAPVAKKPTPAPTPTPQKYDPSSIYKNKVAARRPVSAVSRAPVGRQNSGGGGNRPPSAGAAQRNNDIAAKRRELLEREQRRRGEVRRSEDVKAQHRKLVEKQKQDRINKGKEQWRSNLLDSYGDKKDDSDKKSPRDPPSKPSWMDPTAASPSDPPRGNYARYHDLLDKQMKEREARVRPAAANGGQGDPASVDPVAAAHRAAGLGQEYRQRGAESAEKARVMEDFRERQRQAMVNKARGQADILGGAPKARPPSGRGGVENRPPMGRNAEETDYLQRLKQIRLQNFNERRAARDQQAGRPDSRESERNKKIEALKAQAEERAKQLQAQLEKQRKDALAKNQQAWQQAKPGQQRVVPSNRPSSARNERISAADPSSRAVPARPVSAQAAGGRAAPVKPVPMPGLTNALNVIGADFDKVAVVGAAPAAGKAPSMTNVMQDIGAAAAGAQQGEFQPQARPKWGAHAATPYAGAGRNVDRTKWEDAGKGKVDLSNLALEATASQMEATSAAAVENQPSKRAAWGKPTILKSTPASAQDNRPLWGSPSDTVVNALQSAAVIDSTTVTISPQQAKEAVRLANQKIGETIRVSKPLIAKKPVISAPPQQLLTGATITISKDQPDTVAKGAEGDKGDHAMDTDAASTLESDKTIRLPDTEGKRLADTSVPLFDKVPHPCTPENKMAADRELDVIDLDLDDTEKKLIGSLERAKQPFMQKTSGLMIGITVGHFDCNTSMLRTCSEPDLAKLFRTANNPFVDVAASATFADDSDGADDDDVDGLKANEGSAENVSHTDEEGGEGQSGEGEGSTAEEEEGTEEVDDEEDEDATLYEAELVALMASQSSTSTQESESKYRLDSITPSAEEKDADDLEEGEGEGDAPDGGYCDDEDFAQQDAEDFEKMRETLQQILEDDKSKSANKKALNVTLNEATMGDTIRSLQAGISNIGVSPAGNREEWMSDNSSDSDHGSLHDDEEDMFCRLEESRVNLENELGDVTFLKAYKIVQATQEDEEESIEDGRNLVTKVLGKAKSHLYDKILHLVVSDSAYTDDN